MANRPFINTFISGLAGFSIITLMAIGSSTSFAASDNATQRVQALEKQLQEVRSELDDLQSMHRRVHGASASSEHSTTPAWVRELSMPVVSAPYLGGPTQFDASHLIINAGNIYTDYSLLKQWKVNDQLLTQLGEEPLDHPMIYVSGLLEVIPEWSSDYSGSQISNIVLDEAQISIAVRVNPWLSGLMTIAYDGAPPFTLVSNRRLASSGLYLDKGFITLGNLEKSNFWLSAGDMYVPFGRYDGSMVAPSLARLIGRTQTSAIVGGYMPTQSGPYASVFAFAGDSNIGSSTTFINQYGGDVGFKYIGDEVSADIGVSAIRNIADALGMQNVPGTFSGFGSVNSREQLGHYVPAAAIHGNIGIHNVSFVGEYVTTLRHFAASDLSFNGRGAMPRALQLELGYGFEVMDRPTKLAGAYEQSWDSLALGLAERRLGASITHSFFRNTMARLGYMYGLDYSNSDTATGASNTVGVAGNTITGTSGKEHAVVLIFGVYF